MQASLMFRIGITGMLVSVLVPFIALIMSLFGNNTLSNWISMHFNENIAMLVMLVLITMIIYPLVKKGRQKYIDDMLNNRPGR